METKGYQNLTELFKNRKATSETSPEEIPTIILEQLTRAFNLAPAAGDDHSARVIFYTHPEQIKAVEDFSQNIISDIDNLIKSEIIKEEILKYKDDFYFIGKASVLAIITAKKTPSFLTESLGESASLFFARELCAAMALENLLLAAESLSLSTNCLQGPLAFSQQLETFLGLEHNRILLAIVTIGFKKKK
jgi:nitroreductase